VEDARRLAGGLPEARIEDQRGGIALVRKLQRRVVLACPAHRHLQRAPRVEAGRARVGVHRGLGLGGGLEQRRPLCDASYEPAP
jgi:hypothetical protein